MIIFPAIDIKNGKCVRLSMGDFETEKVYEKNPIKQALSWERMGAKYLHIVDLDGAKTGVGINESIIENIVKNTNIKVQVGGGIRDFSKADRLIKIGVSRIILGTTALEDFNLLKKLVERYGDKIAVSIDAKGGYMATRGWVKKTSQKAIDFAMKVQKIGVRTIVYTDIERDGMLSGPNIKEYMELKEKTNLQIIVSGGISSLEDIKYLKSEEFYGAIVGKALYENKIYLKELDLGAY